MFRSEAPVPWPTLVLCAAATGLGVRVMGGAPFSFEAPLLGPLGAVRLEAAPGLSGPFLLLAGVLGLAAAWAGRHERLGRIDRALVFLFILGLALVPLAGDVVTFVLAWELMSATPGLVLILQAEPEKRSAGRLYLIYSQISALALMSGLLLWSRGGPATFAALALGEPPMAAVLLVLLGAMIKAGIMPFHSWLPEAHPAAPSHVSALMSGAMVALPTYAVLRLLVPWGAPAPIGTTVMLLGALSAALGSLHALRPSDAKRVLALTTIAHMGVLFTVLGLALLLPPGSAPLAALLASAGVAYALTHGLSKGALFLVVGAVHHATGERDLERLGGLWRVFGPLALVAGLAGLALGGLPPFGGFPSELALASALFGALAVGGPLEGVVLLGAIFLIGVGAGAGLAAIAKLVFGSFLGPVRGSAPRHPLPRDALVAPSMLVVLSAVLGLAPGLIWQGLAFPAPDPWSVPTLSGPVVLSPHLALGLTLAAILVVALKTMAPRPARVPPWACGGPPPVARQTYTPQALVMPYRVLFTEILRPGSDLRLQDAPIAPFAPHKGRYEDPMPDYVEPWIHGPIARFLTPKVERLRRLHRGSVQTYLIIGLLVLVLLLFLLPVIP